MQHTYRPGIWDALLAMDGLWLAFPTVPETCSGTGSWVTLAGSYSQLADRAIERRPIDM